MSETPVGYGAAARGGDGGEVIRCEDVQTFREALLATGQRTVVLATGGRTVLAGAVRLGNAQRQVTIECEGGSYWSNSPIVFDDCEDFIVRQARWRTGAEMPGMNLSERDGVKITRSRLFRLEHVSGAYGVDGTLQMYDGVEDGTIAYAILTFPLYEAGHPDGIHAMCCVASAGTGGAPCKRLTFYRGLSQHANARGLKYRDVEAFEAVEWTFHDFGRPTDPANWSKLIELANCSGSVVNSIVLKRDGGTQPKLFAVQAASDVYARGNVDGAGASLDADGLVSSPEPPHELTDPRWLQTAHGSVAQRLRKLAKLWGPDVRDALDDLAVRDIEDRTHRAINAPADVPIGNGGWPT